MTQPDLAPMRRRLLSGAFWSGTGRVVSIGTFFLTLLVLSRALSKAEFAAYAIVSALVPLLATLMSMGTPQILTRTVRQAIYGETPHRTEAAIRGCYRLLLVGAIVLSIVFFLVVPLFGLVVPLFGNEAKWLGLREHQVWILIWACSAAMCVNAAAALQGLDDFKSAVLWGARRGGAVPNLLFLSIVLVAWKREQLDLALLFMSQALVQVVAMWFAWSAIRRRLALLKGRTSDEVNGLQTTIKTEEHSMRWFLGEGWPYLTSQLITLAINESDVLWVSIFSDEEAVAEYVVAKSLIHIVMGPFLLFSMSMGPFVAELIAKNKLERLEQISRGSATLLSLPMLMISLVYVVLPQWVLHYTYGNQYLGAATLLQIMAFGPVGSVIFGSSGQVLLMAGYQKVLMACSIVALVGYVLLAPVAMSLYGVVGAAAIYTFMIVAQNVGVTIAAKRCVGIWTFISFSPSDVWELAAAGMGRKKK